MKTQNGLEAFIQKHRDAFDDQTPPPNLWAGIDRELHGRPSNMISKIRWVQGIAAAVALLIIGAAAGRFFLQPSEVAATRILEQSNPEFLEAEQYYQRTIQQKIVQLTAYNPDETVLHDLKTVDATMAELRKELAAAPKGKEQIIIANLIRSYQAKIAILELVMQRAATIDSTYSKQQRHEISL